MTKIVFSKLFPILISLWNAIADIPVRRSEEPGCSVFSTYYGKDKNCTMRGRCEAIAACNECAAVNEGRCYDTNTNCEPGVKWCGPKDDCHWGGGATMKFGQECVSPRDLCERTRRFLECDGTISGESHYWYVQTLCNQSTPIPCEDITTTTTTTTTVIATTPIKRHTIPLTPTTRQRLTQSPAKDSTTARNQRLTNLTTTRDQRLTNSPHHILSSSKSATGKFRLPATTVASGGNTAKNWVFVVGFAIFFLYIFVT